MEQNIKPAFKMYLLFCGVVISFIFISCGNKEQKTIREASKIDVLIEQDKIDSIQVDTIVEVKDTSWMGPLLLIYYNDAAILKECPFYGDTLSLAENRSWVNNYLNSDAIISIGLNGIQEQQFLAATCKKPYGDCNSQVVLTLKYPEIKGFLANKNFFKTDSIQFFDHREKDKLYFVRNEKEHAFYDSILGLSSDTIKYDSHDYYISGNESFIIEKRGNYTREYNEGLEEERLIYRNDAYRIAYKKMDEWGVSHWTSCGSNTNAPEPIMSCFGVNEIRIVWGFSEGMGDYQMYVSRVDLSSEIPVFENGYKMQGYISMGCD